MKFKQIAIALLFTLIKSQLIFGFVQTPIKPDERKKKQRGTIFIPNTPKESPPKPKPKPARSNPSTKSLNLCKKKFEIQVIQAIKEEDKEQVVKYTNIIKDLGVRGVRGPTLNLDPNDSPATSELRYFFEQDSECAKAIGEHIERALGIVINVSKVNVDYADKNKFEFYVRLTNRDSFETKGRANVKLQTYIETIKGAGIEMVRVPSGKFLMGSPSDEIDRQKHEGPQHEVMISSFYMGKYEVTQSQWRAVSALPKVEIDLPVNPSKFKGENLPIEQVSWYEAWEFCKRLSMATKKSYRLPTEAEWEYACRALTTGRYAGELISFAWFNVNSGSKTHPVGQKQANQFGLYDMHGNVWEWCLDWYGENYYSQSPNMNPTGPVDGAQRVNRGGGWVDNSSYLRAAYRAAMDPDGRQYALGFRIVLTSP